MRFEQHCLNVVQQVREEDLSVENENRSFIHMLSLVMYMHIPIHADDICIHTCTCTVSVLEPPCHVIRIAQPRDPLAQPRDPYSAAT